MFHLGRLYRIFAALTLEVGNGPATEESDTTEDTAEEIIFDSESDIFE